MEIESQRRSITLNREQEQHVQALARSMSRSADGPDTLSQTTTRTSDHVKPENIVLPAHNILSQTTTRNSQDSKSVNPFEDTQGDEKLDPRSPFFDITAWLKSVMRIASRDPENFPVRFPPLCSHRVNCVM